MLKPLKKVKKYLYGGIGTLALLSSMSADADNPSSDPFPAIDTGGSGDVVQTAGTHMETALKYLTVGLGGMLILICIGVIVHRMREDSRDKDHGNLIMTYVLCALGMTIGFVLIGIGWTAFSANITS